MLNFFQSSAFKDQLFPYAYDHVERYLQEHFEEDSLQGIISDLRGLAKEQSLLDPDQVRLDLDFFLKTIVFLY